MNVENDIGLLCKIDPSGEKSSRCLFVTNNIGKLWTTAFNVAQIKSQMRGILVPPAFLELELSKAKNQYYNLTNVKEIDLFPKIRANLVNNAIAQYCIEVLSTTSFFDQSEQVILQLSVNTLKALENGADPRVMLVNYIWRSLNLHYALPDFSAEIYLTKRNEILLIRQILRSSWKNIIEFSYESLFGSLDQMYLFCVIYGNRELENYIEHKLLSFKFANQQIQTLI